MTAEEVVGVVDEPGRGHRRAAASALFRGLEKQAKTPLEARGVVADPARERQTHGRMRVVSAGVHGTRDRRIEPFDRRYVGRCVRLLNGNAIDVEAKNGERSLTARIPVGGGSRESAEFGEKTGGNAVRERALLGRLHLKLVATANGRGFDHLAALANAPTERFKFVDHRTGGFEFGPTRFRATMDGATQVAHRLEIRFKRLGRRLDHGISPQVKRSELSAEKRLFPFGND